MDARVGDAMIRRPVVHASAVSVAEVREFFSSRHAHLALLTKTGAVGEELLGTIDPDDLVRAGAGPRGALEVARLDDRVVRVDAHVEEARSAMLERGRRRAAVVDEQGNLVGLLCLKRHGGGFCTDVGVAARRAARGDA